MKTALSLMFLIISFCSFAQWEIIYENDSMPYGNHITHVGNTIIGAGGGKSYEPVYDNGNIWISSDMGDTWETIWVDPICWGLSVLNPDTIYGGGMDGWYSVTYDGGSTWTNVSNDLGFATDYIDLHFFNDSVGLLYNSYLQRTVDRGNSWTLLDSIYQHCTPGSELDFYDYSNRHFCQVDDSLLFLATTHGILRTTDLGLTWNQIFYDTTREFRAVNMRDSVNGFAVADSGYVYRTTDGWQSGVFVAQLYEQLHDIAFIQDSIVLIAGGGKNWNPGNNDTSGYVFYSPDNGNTWICDRINDKRISSLTAIGDTVFAIGGGVKIFRCRNIQSIVNSIKANASFSYSIFPNPFSDYITVTLPLDEFSRIDIFDIQGRLYRQMRISGINKIDLSELVAGQYFIRIENSRHIYSCPLIKM